MPQPGGGGTAVTPPRIASLDLLPLYLAHSFSHVLLGIYPAVLFVLRAQFHASYTLLGGVFTAATLIYGLGAFPTGLLLNRWHPLTVIRVCLLLAAVAAGIIAVAPSAAAMAAGLLLLGLALSPYHTAANTMLSRVSGNDARLTAHHGMFGSLGLARLRIVARLGRGLEAAIRGRSGRNRSRGPLHVEAAATAQPA